MTLLQLVDTARVMVDLGQPLHGVTVILMGGAPTIKEQPLHLLEGRGVVTAAINNAARHFRPTYWFSADNPNAFDPRILMDSTIMKFGAGSHIETELEVNGLKFGQCPNIAFYLQKDNVPMHEALAPRMEVPWYRNTLFVAIHVLYQLGCRRIVLGGSDFEFSPTGSVYAHQDGLNHKERDLNVNIYTKLAADLVMMVDVFEKAGLTLMDCSARSKLGAVYEVISMEQAVELCLERVPADWADAASLRHGTQFANDEMKERLGIRPDAWADLDDL